jgi:hypothetical protein
MTVWLTVHEIQVMHPRLSPSHIYKLASVHQWRRIRRGRTVTYQWDDVCRTLEGDAMDDDRWIIITTFPSGDVAYLGENRTPAPNGTRTPYRGNAFRYPTENAALGAAYHAKELGIIGDFHVEELPPRPRFKNPDTPSQ